MPRTCRDGDRPLIYPPNLGAQPRGVFQRDSSITGRCGTLSPRRMPAYATATWPTARPPLRLGRRQLRRQRPHLAAARCRRATRRGPAMTTLTPSGIPARSGGKGPLLLLLLGGKKNEKIGSRKRGSAAEGLTSGDLVQQPIPRKASLNTGENANPAKWRKPGPLGKGNY